MIKSWGIPILMALCFASGLLLRYTPFRKMVNRKQKCALFIGYAVALVVNAIIVIPLFAENPNTIKYVELDMLIFGGVTVLWNMLVIRKHIREHLFIYGMVLTCNYLILVMPVYLVHGIFLNSFSLDIKVVLSGAVLLLLGFWPIHLLLSRTVEPFLSLDSGKYWNTIWFIPLALYLSMIFSFPEDVKSTTIPQLLSSLTIASVAVLMCLSIANDHKAMRDREALEKNLTDQKLYYAQMQQSVLDARAMKHDIKHHFAAVQRYIDSDDKQGLEEYCGSFLSDKMQELVIPYTGNVAADGVVYRYMQLAHRNKVDFQYTGKISSEGIADMDLCVLLGNALENAMTGCLTVEKNRSISLISERKGDLLSIVVRNTFDGRVIQKGKHLLSRKRENERGIGMRSMGTVCRRYGGTMQTDWDSDTFTVLFLLPVK